jgi:hypothetical protein
MFLIRFEFLFFRTQSKNVQVTAQKFPIKVIEDGKSNPALENAETTTKYKKFQAKRNSGT